MVSYKNAIHLYKISLEFFRYVFICFLKKGIIRYIYHTYGDMGIQFVIQAGNQSRSTHIISYHIISYEIVSYHNSKHFQLSFQHPFHLSSLTWSRLNQELVVNNARCEQAGSCTGRVRYFMYIQYPLNLEILPR